MCVRFVFRPAALNAATLSELYQDTSPDQELAPDHPGAIVCRITVDKARKRFNTPAKCKYREWDAQDQQLKGKSTLARRYNMALDGIKSDLNGLYLEMERRKEYVTADRLYAAYSRGSKPRLSFLESWQQWLELRTPLVGNGLSQAVLDAGKIRYKRLKAFLESEGMGMLLPEEFTAKWCDRFITWMRVHRSASQNYTNKVVQTIKQVLSWCVRHEHATLNPLDKYGLKFAPTPPPVFLTGDEIQALENYRFANEVYRNTADIFLFQCYTGLAYADLKRFDAGRDIKRGDKGRPWIFMTRQKTQDSTGQEITVPLLDRALAILDRHKRKLPVPSNQVYNRVLKEIAATLNLSQRVTTHVGRKTAGRLLLDEGFSMAAVSKFLGHKTVAMTEKYYVRAGEELVAREVERLHPNRSLSSWDWDILPAKTDN
ncbi:site-specific integrase [Hymenobacter sp. BT491]|uniref:site-specific integrase n=1 Tax=Hymenobacter sp. BT491 TaxID=2766779 RepID=UPI00165362AA|nr:site-specific integrase [Hymenobacter sp. BT491]MBC6988909.1 site-specific integrase [Hymenobacter sp. BT491]